MICDTKFTMGWPPRKDAPVWLTIGNFDGVHLGHQALIQELRRLSTENKSMAMLINFWPHPRVYFSQEKAYYLTTRGEKTGLLSKLGINDVVTLDFDQNLASMEASDFIAELVHHVNVKGIVVGENFALGKGRKGTPEVLAELCKTHGVDFRVFQSVTLKEKVVSSTLIRAALSAGKVDEAGRLLGRPYAMCSKVISGEKVGKSIGVPTANLEIDPDKFLPRIGVYATIARLQDKAYQAVTSIGTRPTFGDDHDVSIETLILDFDDDIYGEDLRIEFIRWLRPEEKYDSVQSLIEQIEEDKTVTRRIFENGFE